MGRKPNVDGIGLETVGIQMNKRYVAVDEYMRTNIPHIYAIGDITGIAPLAHVASAQGIVAAENCFGANRRMDYRAIPNVVYTVPEVASVGLTEKQAREQGYEVKVGKFPPRILGRAMAAGIKEGLVKVVAEAKYGQILGVHICCEHASDLLQEAVLAIKLKPRWMNWWTLSTRTPRWWNRLWKRSTTPLGTPFTKRSSRLFGAKAMDIARPPDKRSCRVGYGLVAPTSSACSIAQWSPARWSRRRTAPPQ